MQAAHTPTNLINLRILLKFSTTLTQKKPPIYSVNTHSALYKPLFSYHKYRLKLFFFFPKQSLVLESLKMQSGLTWIYMFIYSTYLGLRNIKKEKASTPDIGYQKFREPWEISWHKKNMKVGSELKSKYCFLPCTYHVSIWT